MKVHLRGRGLVGNHLVLLPWRVPAFISNNIVTAQTFWERLWMNCEVQSTGQIRETCSTTISILVSMVTSIVGRGGAGSAPTARPEGSGTKAQVATAAGVLFLIARGAGSGVPQLDNCVITDSYNPLVHQGLKKELGAAIFICWSGSSHGQRDGPGRDKGWYKNATNTTTNPARSQGTTHV
ncbi:claudin-like protein ZF-A9 [Salmo salar]|uniref:Claudin-like protein ZF-A9 n=1 Tax=Salmo salar TaxID=8030 RepID=A0A1S3MY03_SALSA|nr:claudin-like protein ZF-A9 [Salmo salar]